MNIIAVVYALLAFAIGYIAGMLTGRLLKFALTIVVLAAIAFGLYYYFLR